MNSEKMGTSTNNNDGQPDKQTKLAKLQVRKKELEILLAAKNEELYKLCVQEVHLTGIVPPEAPLSPEPISQIRVEKLPPKKSQGKKVIYNDDITSKDDTHSHRKSRHSRQPETSYETDNHARKHNVSHRLSTPSISGMSTRSSTSKQPRREETISYNYNLTSPLDRSPETFSMHSSKTCPSLQFKTSQPTDSLKYALVNESNAGPSYRQHTVTTEQTNKVYYNGVQQDSQNFSRVKETHFSSSHPDITTHYTHMSMSTQQLPQSNTNTMPLLYQYASHLKAQSQHLSSLSHGTPAHVKRKGELSRRNTLQRTQTYHLTSHSDYNSHLDNMNCNIIYPIANNYKQDVKSYTSPNNYHLQQRNDRIAQPQHAVVKRQPSMSSQYKNSPTNVSNNVNIDFNPSQTNTNKGMSVSHSYSNLDNVSLSGHSQHSFTVSDAKVKEKQWYETSLDSPAESIAAQTSTRESFASLPKNINLQRTSSLNQSHAPKFDGSPLSPSRQSNTSGSSQTAGPQSPLYRNDVPLESPKNCTVIEQGKWIPYREVSKPFEMSDFYKYSTKFRQANGQKSNLPNAIVSPQGPYQTSPNVQEQWINHNH